MDQIGLALAQETYYIHAGKFSLNYGHFIAVIIEKTTTKKTEM